MRVYDVFATSEDGEQISVTFDPPVLLVLTYNPDELPENTVAVYLALYDEVSGTWTRLEPPPDYVVRPGEVATYLTHLSVYAVMVEAAPEVVVSPPFRDVTWLLFVLLMFVLLLFSFLIRRRRRRAEQG